MAYARECCAAEFYFQRCLVHFHTERCEQDHPKRVTMSCAVPVPCRKSKVKSVTRKSLGLDGGGGGGNGEACVCDFASYLADDKWLLGFKCFAPTGVRNLSFHLVEGPTVHWKRVPSPKGDQKPLLRVFGVMKSSLIACIKFRT